MNHERVETLFTELAQELSGADLGQQFALYAGFIDRCLRSMSEAQLREALEAFENVPSTLKFNLRSEIERRGGLPPAPKAHAPGPIERGEMPGFVKLVAIGNVEKAEDLLGTIAAIEKRPEFAYCFEGEMEGWLFVKTPIGWKALINAQHELAHARKMQ